MSCDECTDAQGDRGDERNERRWYIRVGRADVEIVACEVHVAQTMRLIREGTKGV